MQPAGPGPLDAWRFAELLGEGRSALARGEPEEPAERLGAALAREALAEQLVQADGE